MVAVAPPLMIASMSTGRTWSQPIPDGAGRAIQISLLESFERPLIWAMASRTVSFPVTGNLATLSP